ncbi:Tn3 family transposase [Streptomyces sp. NPDC057889]|uniref:Tn3 family transposase n=1 Tax=unclassified Streptomyces TaxID=2593676 RepID=UPI0036BF1927
MGVPARPCDPDPGGTAAAGGRRAEGRTARGPARRGLTHRPGGHAAGALGSPLLPACGNASGHSRPPGAAAGRRAPYPSIKFGHATASLIGGKLSDSCRQNTLAAALKEYGALRRTIHAAHYLADETYCRKIARQLDKGESLHSLRRDLHFAHQGKIRERFLAGQTEQA